MRCTTFPCSSCPEKKFPRQMVAMRLQQNQNAGLGHRNEKDLAPNFRPFGFYQHKRTLIAASISPYTSNVGNMTSKIDLVDSRAPVLKILVPFLH